MTETVGSGWFDDPAIWNNGVPGTADANGNVKNGHVVRYRSDDPNTALGFITVEDGGSLLWDTSVKTSMKVDTIIGEEGSYIEIENPDNVIKSRIVWDTSTDIDPSIMNFATRGIMSQGEVKIVGAEKTHMVEAFDALAGETTITLDKVPVGWAQGDRMGVAATYRRGWKSQSFVEPESEEVTIVGIQGKVVSFFPALKNDHTRQFADKAFHVTNHTRNICFESENPDIIHRRGHGMFMAPDCQRVEWAEFRHMGRTDKSQRSFNASELATLSPNTNIHGRYPLHAHTRGVRPEDDMVLFKGCVVAHSPGWGIVAHQSKVAMVKNVTFDCFGAGFMWEDGSEVDMTVGNIAMLTRGIDAPIKGPHYTLHDNGKVGVGFFWQSRGFKEIRDNISCDHHYGYGFQHRFTQAAHIDSHYTATGIFTPENFTGKDTNELPIENFDNNTAYACKNGLHILKANPMQFHMLRTSITNFCAWEILDRGIFYEYTGNYTTKDFFLAASRGQQSFESCGFRSHTSTYGMVFINGEVHNFAHGVEIANKITGRINKPREAHFMSHVLNVAFTNVGTELAEWNTAGSNGSNATNNAPYLPKPVIGEVYDPPQNIRDDNFVPIDQFDVEVDEDQLCWPNNFPVTQDTPDTIVSETYWANDVLIAPIVSDSIGTQLMPIGWSDFLRMRNAEVIATLTQHGYWYENGVPYFKWPVQFEDRTTCERSQIDFKIRIKKPIDSSWKLKPSAPPLFDFRTAGQPLPSRPTIVH